MSNALPITAKQPAEWPRLPLSDCFQMVASRTRIGNGEPLPTPAQPGDLILSVDPNERRIHAHLVLEGVEAPRVPRSGAILRPLGPVRPEWLSLVLDSPQSQRGLYEAATTRSTFAQISWKSLGAVEIAAPDLTAQAALIKDQGDSVGGLANYVANMRKMLDTLDKLGASVTNEMLTGKADRRQAFLYVSQALAPAMRSARQASSPSTDASEAAPTEPVAVAPRPRGPSGP